MSQPQTENTTVTRVLKSFSLTTQLDGNQAKLELSVWRSNTGFVNPRFTIWTGAKGEKPLNIPLSPIIAGSIFRKIEKVALGAPDGKEVVHSFTKVDGAKKLAGAVVVGKESSGVVWLGVKAEGKPNVKFTFETGDFASFRDSENNPVSAQDASSQIAIDWARRACGVLDATIALLTPDFVSTPKENGGGGNFQKNNGGDWKKKSWDNKGGGGDWKNRNNDRSSGGDFGGNPKIAIDDDDIPF